MATPTPDPSSELPLAQPPLPEFRTLTDDDSSQLCTRCRELLCTDGLRQAISREGFVHTVRHESQSINLNFKRCPLCRFILKRFRNMDQLVVKTGLNQNGIPRSYVMREQSGRRRPMFSNFVLVANHDDPASKICAARPLVQDFKNESVTASIRNQLRQCLDHHEECCLDAETLPLLPTRVLDLSPESTGETCKLHVPQNGERAEYVCLSYCWGGPQAYTLTTNNIKDLECKVKMEKLGKTLQDAITTVRSLGIRYLWVDALCIIQQGGGDEDKLHEIGKMSRIYKDATLVLAAACAETSNCGFLHPRHSSPPVDEICRVRVLVGGEVGTLSAVRPKMYYHSSSGHDDFISPDHPLDNRAWAFQECALARRLLLFSKWELFWHCQKMPSRPIRPTHLSLNNPRIKTFNSATRVATIGDRVKKKKAWIGDWIEIVKDYTSRQMTEPGDTLHALAGIAEEVGRLTGQTYVFGMWREHLIRCLCWSRVKRGTPRFQNEDLTVPVAPTWSWASCSGTVGYNYVVYVYGGFTEVAEVMVVPEYPSSKASWALKLRGNIWPIETVDWDVYGTYPDGKAGGITGPVFKFFLAYDTDSGCGLFLQKTGPQEYRRLGFWQEHMWRGDEYKAKPVEEIWII